MEMDHRRRRRRKINRRWMKVERVFQFPSNSANFLASLPRMVGFFALAHRKELLLLERGGKGGDNYKHEKCLSSSSSKLPALVSFLLLFSKILVDPRCFKVWMNFSRHSASFTEISPSPSRQTPLPPPPSLLQSLAEKISFLSQYNSGRWSFIKKILPSVPFLFCLEN